MTLSSEFVQAVREGKIAGLEWQADYHQIRSSLPEMILPRSVQECEADHICALLRRVWWNDGAGYEYSLESNALRLYESRIDPDAGPYQHEEMFTQESELDRHVTAALWVLGREG